jgi:hypothetical protein
MQDRVHAQKGAQGLIAHLWPTHRAPQQNLESYGFRIFDEISVQEPDKDAHYLHSYST